MQPWFDRATQVVQAYDDRLVAPSDPATLTPLDLAPVPLAGRTPGHTGYRLRTSRRSRSPAGTRSTPV